VGIFSTIFIKYGHINIKILLTKSDVRNRIAFKIEHAIDSLKKGKKTGMKHTEKTFQILDALDREEISTQRQLADNSGISLGQVNYILKSLLDKGLVKIRNFKKSPNKISYVYFLTPKGIEEKSKLAVKFVLRKLREYEFLRARLTERLLHIEEEGFTRIIFIGPLLVKEFIENIISEKEISLILIDHHENASLVRAIDKESFNIALLFDEDINVVEKISTVLEIPEDRVMNLL
jgi:EPS-associated MarR family transcriptional regulator